MLLWLVVALAADVTAPFGPTHEVPLDLEEGTWMSVAVHGDQVVFDLLGDLWMVPLVGGEARRLTEGPAFDVQPSWSADGSELLFTSDRGGNENVWRMALDGSDPVAVTDDDVARFTHGVHDPDDPDWVVVRKRTVDTRSIGVTELWQVHRSGGDGFALTSADEHPHAGEPALHGPFVYFSSRVGRFEYVGDAHRSLWSIQRLDRRDGSIRPIASGTGSASHPMVHPDGDQLVFVTRHETQTHLVAMDLETGQRTVLWKELSPDGMEGFALHGTYPRMDWTDDGRLVLWAQGKLWSVDPRTGARSHIPFHLKGTWRLHDVARPRGEVPDRVVAHVVRQPAEAPDGRVAFSALGQLWVQGADGVSRRVGEGPGFAPAWHPDGQTLAYTSFHDATSGALHLVDGKGQIETLPVRGQLLHPSWSADGEQLVALRGVGGGTSPDTVDEPWYEVVLLTRPQRRRDPWQVSVVTSVDNRGPRAPRPRLHDGRVWFFDDVEEQPRTPPSSRLVSVDPDGGDQRVHLTLPGVDEVSLSPDGRHVAYKHHHQLFIAPLPAAGSPVSHEALPVRQVTRVVGDWLHWSPDGTRLMWMEGNQRKSIDVQGILDAETSEERGLDDLPGVQTRPLRVAVPRARPTSTLFFERCDRVVSFAEGSPVQEGASILVVSDRIQSVGTDLQPPDGALVVDCAGLTAMPGLIDVHAHMHFSSGDALPQQPWRYQVALDYGVTTVHDPSAFTDEVFTQRQRVAAGLAEGPRIWSTGSVLYGALSNDGARTESLDDARAHVRRLKAVGARSVKVYQQSQRERRQWFSQACREEEVLCVPEGGGDLWMDLSMVADGYHAVEHSLPVTPLYADVIGYLRGSTVGGDGLGTFYTPTLQVAFGGLPAMHLFEQAHDPYDDPLLARHTPWSVRAAQLWRRRVWARDTDARYRLTAADAARAQQAGLHVTLGAHGELQGLGVHWELWALGGDGAMAPLDALRAGTLDGARYLGLDHVIGRVEPGYFADLLFVRGDPTTELTDSVHVEHVVKNGQLVREGLGGD
jgi:imidazolonepropionase-like amidohydrolase